MLRPQAESRDLARPIEPATADRGGIERTLEMDMTPPAALATTLDDIFAIALTGCGGDVEGGRK